MHETGVAIEIYRASLQASEAYGPGRLEHVRVAVGELSAVDPELLAYAWEAVVAGTRDEGCPLDVAWQRARQSCAACGQDKERAEGSWLPVCPDCGEFLTVEGGRELDLLQVSYLPDEPGGAHV